MTLVVAVFVLAVLGFLALSIGYDLTHNTKIEEGDDK